MRQSRIIRCDGIWTPPGARPAERVRPGGAGRRDGDRAHRDPRRGHRPPRPQARQRAAVPAGAEGDRLRDRPRTGRGRRPDLDGPGRRYPRLHGSRTVLRGTSGPPADIFAWGCVVVAAATGKSPFASRNIHEALYRVLHDPPGPGRSRPGPARPGRGRARQGSRGPADRQGPAGRAGRAERRGGHRQAGGNTPAQPPRPAHADRADDGSGGAGGGPGPTAVAPASGGRGRCGGRGPRAGRGRRARGPRALPGPARDHRRAVPGSFHRRRFGVVQRRHRARHRARLHRGRPLPNAGQCSGLQTGGEGPRGSAR